MLIAVAVLAVIMTRTPAGQARAASATGPASSGTRPAAPSPANAQAGGGPVASTVTSACAKLVRDWQATPGGQAFRQVISDMQQLRSADPGAIPTDAAGNIMNLTLAETTMLDDPVPSCADRHHHWRRLARALRDSAIQSRKLANGNLSAATMQRLFTDSSRIQTGDSALLQELKQEGLWPA